MEGDAGATACYRAGMTVISLEEFAATAPPTGRLVGLDLGTKTIGIAVSDALRQIASPRQTIKRTKFGKDAEALLAVFAEEQTAQFW